MTSGRDSVRPDGFTLWGALRVGWLFVRISQCGRSSVFCVGFVRLLGFAIRVCAGDMFPGVNRDRVTVYRQTGSG